MFSVAVAGQLISASIIDHRGILGTAVKPFTKIRFLSVVVALAGCILSVRLESLLSPQTLERLKQGDAGVAIGVAFMVLLCGLSLPMQTCINRYFARIRCGGDARKSSLFSFFSGSCVLAVVSGIVSAVMIYAYDRAIWDFAATSWWMFTGGVFGALNVHGALIMAPRVGMTRLYMLVVFGQLVSALLYDHFGVLGVSQFSATPLRISGTILIPSPLSHTGCFYINTAFLTAFLTVAQCLTFLTQGSASCLLACCSAPSPHLLLLPPHLLR